MKVILTLLAGLALAIAVPQASHANRASDMAAGAAIAAGILAIGAIAASSANSYPAQRPHHRPPPATAPFSPAAHVTCYPARRICFRDNGRVARMWTDRFYP